MRDAVPLRSERPTRVPCCHRHRSPHRPKRMLTAWVPPFEVSRGTIGFAWWGRSCGAEHRKHHGISGRCPLIR